MEELKASEHILEFVRELKKLTFLMWSDVDTMVVGESYLTKLDNLVRRYEPYVQCASRYLGAVEHGHLVPRPPARKGYLARNKEWKEKMMARVDRLDEGSRMQQKLKAIEQEGVALERIQAHIEKLERLMGVSEEAPKAISEGEDKACESKSSEEAATEEAAAMANTET